MGVAIGYCGDVHVIIIITCTCMYVCTCVASQV